MARLARLQLSEEEIESFRDEISAILAYVEQLQHVNLDGIEPTYQVTGLINVTREDTEVAYGSTPEELLKNAPATENGQLKVKRMLS